MSEPSVVVPIIREIAEVIAKVGVPTAVAAYLLVRLNGKLDPLPELRKELALLREELKALVNEIKRLRR